MRKKTILKNFFVIIGASSTALLASSCHDTSEVRDNNTTQKNDLAQYETLVNELKTLLNNQNVYISNSLVNDNPIKNLITLINQEIENHLFSSDKLNELKIQVSNAKDSFLADCNNALKSQIAILNKKVNLFTSDFLNNVQKQIKDTVNQAINAAQMHINEKNIAAILKDISVLDNLYGQIVKEKDQAEAELQLFKQELLNFNSKLDNFKNVYKAYSQLITLLNKYAKVDQDVNSDNLSQVKQALQNAEQNFALLQAEASVINYDSDFKAWVQAHKDMNPELSKLANAVIKSFENNFNDSTLLSAEQLNEIKQAFDLNVENVKKQYLENQSSEYSGLYTETKNLIVRLSALPSTKSDAAEFLKRFITLPDNLNNLPQQQKTLASDNLSKLNHDVLEKYPLNIINLKEAGQKSISLVLNPKTTNENMGYDLNVNSASINKQNFNLYLKEANSNAQIKISSREEGLNPDNIDQLQVKYALSTSEASTYILKNVDFDFKLTSLLNRINYEYIDDLYNLNYNQFAWSYEENFVANLAKNFSNMLSPKFKKLQQYFTYELINSTINFSNGKISAQVNIKFKNSIVKTLTLTTKNTINFKNLLNRKVNMSLLPSLTNNPKFKDNSTNNLLYAFAYLVQSALYKEDPNSTIGYNPNDWIYVENLMSTSNLPNRYSSFDYSQKFRLLNKMLHNVTNLSLEGYNKWELVNYSKDNIFIYNDRKHAATFKVKFTGSNKEPFVYDLVIQTLNGQKNYLQNEEIFKLSDYLKNTSDILSKAVINNPKLTHSNFYAGEGVKKLNELYTLPKFGDYQIIFDINSPNNYTVNNVEGFANVNFAVTLNGQIVNNKLLKSPKFKLNYFRPLVYTDIKPSNNKTWFTSEDFANIGSNNDVKNKVALINSYNFEYRTLFGKRVFDADTLMQEQAFDKLNYLFKFKGEKAPEENNDKFDNKDYDEKDKGPSAPTLASGNDISNPGDQQHTVDPNSLLGSYFVYYYDVKALFNPRYRTSTMTFKVGFINKWNWNDRYTTGEITLRNLKNDFADEFFPDIILNKITNNQIFISGIETITASQFASDIKSNTPHYWSLNINAPAYKKYLLYRDQFSISDVKMIDDKNGRAMIRLAYQQKPRFGNRKYIGEVWYEISGFKTIPDASEVSYSDDQLLALPFKQKMKKIFRANGDVLIQRTNEITANDNYWLLNKNTGKVEYTLPSKYFKPILEQSNKQAYVNVHLSANVKFLDSISYARVFSYTNGKLGGINLSFNYNDLIKNGSVIIKQSTEKIQPKGTITPFQIDYTMTVTLNEQGMHFEFGLDDPKYKITQDNPVTSLFKQPELTIPNNLQNTFNPNQAFFFDYFAGDISYQYTNNIAEEDFGTNNSTNVISYKNMDYTQENMPIVLSNKDSFDDPFKYNPNQMLSYKLQDGYKFNNEYLNRSYVATSPVAQDLMSRSFAMNYGSGMMVAKVNSDPNDGRFYALTNHHVINNDAKNWTPEKITFDAGTSPTIAGLDFGNNVDAGFSYWNGLYNQGTKVQVVWSGINQVGYSSQIDWNTGMFKTGMLDKNRFLDVTLIIFDVNPLIKQLKAEGKFQTAMWYQNWFNLKNLTFSSFLDKQSVNRDKNIHHSLFNGFPYGKQSSYIIHRNESGYETDSFKKQTPYEPTYYNAGNSGTGVMNNLGEYVTTINSGGPLWLLVGKNGAFNSGLYSYNFYGVNEEGQNPLDLINYHSMARNIMRLNAFDPDVYDIPWFFKNWNK
ncbi:MGA_1079 family surface serine endopeptidase [Mycoplasma sp. Z473B]|uniref:MGA_1079 family surface serine endopeptidase n=1 Tax=Mycoplasma sp. Z473B TaxID=3401667 RepID=UPI003AAF52D6